MSVAKLSYDYKEYSFPENWEEYRLSQLLEIVERPVNMVDDQEYDLITIKRNFGGIESRGKLTGENILVKNQFEIREGDFIISKRQIVHGACAVVPKKYEGATVSNEYDVMNCNNGVLPLFFDYYVQLPFMRRYFYITSDGVHVEKLRFKTCDWLRQKIRVPSITGQHKIISILTTWDKAIELKEQLINEKRRQKKWLMQNLLTGKNRLPGFNSKWQEVKIRKILKIKHGKDQKDVECLSGNIPILASGGQIGWAKEPIYSKPSVLIGRKGTINKPVFIDIPFWTIDTLFYSEISNNAFAKWVYYYFCLINWRKYDESTGVPSLSLNTIESISMNLPPIPEQAAIAEILSTADREIKLHEKELYELKKQKKALMQLLLTGIVRVNTKEVS